MNQYTLIGYPLGHSMSPWIHERLFRMSGQEAAYSLTEIAPEHLSAAVPELQKLAGFNITIPHKVGIIPFVDTLDEGAARYQSVNTVAVRDGKLFGYNTDCVGFCRSVGTFSADDRILLIGCGGVGRMMATEAYLHGVQLTITEKNLSLAEELAQELQAKFPDTGSTVRILDTPPEEDFDLLMNASPVGMYPNVNRCPVSDAVIARCGKVFDVIYNPTETCLVRKAKALGKSAAGGSAMLVWQAVRAHEIWYGFQYEAEEIDKLVTEMEAEVTRLFPAKEES